MHPGGGAPPWSMFEHKSCHTKPMIEPEIGAGDKIGSGLAVTCFVSPGRLQPPTKPIRTNPNKAQAIRRKRMVFKSSFIPDPWD